MAVKFSRTYRALVAGRVIVTVLPVEGLNVYPVGATIVEKPDPSVLPDAVSVWVRVLHEDDGGRSSTIRLKLLGAPRSTWSHCGNALLALSQQVLVLPSVALPGT